MSVQVSTDSGIYAGWPNYTGWPGRHARYLLAEQTGEEHAS